MFQLLVELIWAKLDRYISSVFNKDPSVECIAYVGHYREKGQYEVSSVTYLICCQKLLNTFCLQNASFPFYFPFHFA